MSEWLYIKAPNGSNGNPRRLYAQVQDGNLQALIDEGYSGPLVAHILGAPMDPFVVNVTAGEYRRLAKLADGIGVWAK